MPLIYLARHATPDRSRTDLPYHLQPGPPLTGHGRGLACQLGEYFRQAGVRTILTSPLERCLHTARIAAEIAGASLTIEAALTEWQPDEKPEDVRQRMEPVFDASYQICTEDGPVALVTHGGPIAVLLEWLGMDRATLQSHRVYDYGNLLPPAAVWLAEREVGETSWKLSLAFIPN